MTSCLFAKGKDCAAAVADGRLSISDTVTSFETAGKIVRVMPRFFIPSVHGGHFNVFSEYTAEDWFVAYAGTHALVTEVISEFSSRVGDLYLDRGDKGVPFLSHSFDRSGWFDDSFNFRNEEVPHLGARDILQEFRDAAQIKCDHWSANRAIFPDCEFILFGQDMADWRHYKAYTIKPDPNGWSPSASVRLAVEEIPSGRLATIGSTEVAGRAFEDVELITALSDWADDERAYRSIQHEGGDMPSPVSERWSSPAVAKRFSDLILASNDPAVGGNVTKVICVGTRMFVERAEH